MEKRKYKKHGLFSKIGNALEKNAMPVGAPFGYRIELVGQKEHSRVLISGARRILICTDEQIVVEAKEKQIRFLGKGLDCLCYDGGVAEISGNIGVVSLSEGECV